MVSVCSHSERRYLRLLTSVLVELDLEEGQQYQVDDDMTKQAMARTVL